jgi:hypothetical protein
MTGSSAGCERCCHHRVKTREFKTMDFKTHAHSDAYEKTREFLYSIFGETGVSVIDDLFALQEGSAFVYIRVFPVGTSSAGVEVFSYVVADVGVTEELMRHLLTYNLRLTFGGLGLAIAEDGKGSVVLRHAILGDKMDREELYASVSAIASVADELDDQLVAAFGGRTALDEIQYRERPRYSER